MTQAQQGGGRRGLLGLVAGILVLMACVVAASAWLRLAQARVDCGAWPACRGSTAALAERAALAATRADPQLGAAHTLERVRGFHRVVATLALLGVVALVVALLRERPRRPRLLRPALGLLGLALFLSALGVVTPGSRATAVLLGNLLGGFLMLALAATLLARLLASEPATARLARRAAWAAALWLAMCTLGAVSGAGGAHLAPPLHLALAVLALPFAARVAWASRTETSSVARAVGVVLAGLVPLQFVLGALAAGQAAQPGWVLLHNSTAAWAGAALLALAASHDSRA